jgi:structural maintenance of chromosome 1
VVVDTLKEARELFKRHRDKRFKIVTVDGTVLHKSGNMSGGVTSFHEKAAHWDEAAVSKLRQKRDEYLREMVELERVRRSSDREQIASTQLLGLQNRLKYSGKELESIEANLAKEQKTAAAIESDLKALKKPLETARKQVATLEAEIETIKQDIDAQEDEFLA